SGGALRVREVLRGGRPAGPPDETEARPGDELVLEGSAEAFARAAHLFRADGGAAMPEPAPPPVTSRAEFVDPESPVALAGRNGCAHLAEARTVFPGTRGCEECLRDGTEWVHLRLCMTCGHVGCCDTSPQKHATAHFHATRHPVIRSLQPGEEWAWCYEDEVLS
ncbi:MAG TPA: UBP-type zinc finger domain-containing protein, partial [Longimicrobiaceae bacterium]|nr:UBP-type zinc finger domain-containing protein [Longimicrobiaceae bacterium]